MALQFGSGKYFQDTLNGNVFIGTTAAAGVVLPIFSNTAQTFALWNPLGSGRNAILISCQIGWVSGPGVPGNFVYGFQTGTGAQIATGAPITAFTTVAPVNGLIGAGNATITKFAPATATLTAGPTLYRTMGVSQLTTTAGATTQGYFQATEYFDGTVIVPQGCIFCVASNVAAAVTADVTLIWEEI